jgi:hypothetical protein
MLTRYEISMDFAYLPVIVVLRFVFSSIFNDLTVLCFENNAIVVQDAPGM